MIFMDYTADFWWCRFTHGVKPYPNLFQIFYLPTQARLCDPLRPPRLCVENPERRIGRISTNALSLPAHGSGVACGNEKHAEEVLRRVLGKCGNRVGSGEVGLATAAEQCEQAKTAEEGGAWLGDDKDHGIEAALGEVATHCAVAENVGGVLVEVGGAAEIDREAATDQLICAFGRVRPVPANKILEGEVAQREAAASEAQNASAGQPERCSGEVEGASCFNGQAIAEGAARTTIVAADGAVCSYGHSAAGKSALNIKAAGGDCGRASVVVCAYKPQQTGPVLHEVAASGDITVSKG